jgi:malonyl-CoA decarboxylase
LPTDDCVGGVPLFEKIKQVRRNARERVELTRLIDDCKQLLSERGEANSVAIATRALEHYSHLSVEGRERFFEVLANNFDPDPGEVLQLAEAYAVSRSPENLIKLARAAEPPRQELLRRLNRAPGATGAIVKMRAELLEQMRTIKQQNRLIAVDSDLEHLLGSWFNPGFLTLAKVDWNSPAMLLEKIIHHEAVHEIDGWNDLRRRLQPDRRLFVFFHPVWLNEPLIFVEVALVKNMPSAIGPLLDRNLSPEVNENQYKIATFYSISNCQPGLKGVNLGNFLIKRVAEELKKEFPKLSTFCTLSPIPTFASWLMKTEPLQSDSVKALSLKQLNLGIVALRQKSGGDLSKLEATEQDQKILQRLAAFYLMHTKSSNNVSSDPVARFHLNNGARLERVNVTADLSKKGLKQSCGAMVNYLYDLDEIESNHESFIAGEVAVSKALSSSI